MEESFEQRNETSTCHSDKKIQENFYRKSKVIAAAYKSSFKLEGDQKPDGKKDRLEEIKEDITKFSQQVNEYIKGSGKEDFPRIASQNELAILRHAKAIVDDQLANPPDEESKTKLLHVRKQLEQRISYLEGALEGSKDSLVYVPKGTITWREKAAIAGITAAGIGLITLGAYLSYQRLNDDSS